MKAIRLGIFQQLTSYKKPNTQGESFHLPPFSTIIGMIHAACGFKKYHPLKISVQGEYTSVINDLQTTYSFGGGYHKDRDDGETGFKVLNDDNKPITVTKGVNNIQLLSNVNLVIHILPENEEDLEIIRNGLMNPKNFLSLGRHKDIIRIDDLEIVELKELNDDESITTKHNMYIPLEMLDEDENYSLVGSIEKVKKKYVINENGIRDWIEIVKCKYVSPDELIVLTNGYKDIELGIPVCFG